MEFLQYNVSNWQVWDTLLYDDEVTIEVMSQQMARLLRKPGNVCPNQLYDLALEFHRKVMVDAIVRNQYSRQMVTSVRFVGDYYRLRADQLNTQQAMAVAKHLMFMNQYCFKNEAAIKAYELLYAHNVHHPLLGQHRRYFLNLAVMVGKQYPQLLRKAAQQWPAKVIKGLFYGPYNLSPNTLDAGLAVELLGQ